MPVTEKDYPKVAPDCFAFRWRKDKHGTVHPICTALTHFYCRYGENCPFYKTKEQRAKEVV